MAMDLEVLGLMIKRAQYRDHRTMDAALREVGVTLVQWDALRAIQRMPGASAHELAVTTFQSDQSFGALATRLVNRGLIARTAGRGRRIEHALTDDGRRALDHGHRIAGEVLDDLFAPLDETDRVTLSRILGALLAEDPPASGA